MLLGVRSFNYNKKAYAAYALMETNKEELEAVLNMIEFETDTDPEKNYIYLDDRKLWSTAEKLGWKPLDIDKFPEIFYKENINMSECMIQI